MLDSIYHMTLKLINFWHENVEILPSLTQYYNGGSSVVECWTQDREVAGLSLTGLTALWSLSKTLLS